jgi:NAD(P)-dependent dehydrogenase (short-subunit alcohol dehydrogenase family)
MTGGATGIGLDTASRLAADGATVVIASRNTTRGESAAEAIRAFGGRATFIMTDVTEDSQVAALAKQAAAEGDGIGIWFNNAGVEGGLGPLGAFDDLTVRQLLDTNVKGVYSGMRYAGEHMRAGGLIINTASFVGTVMPMPVGIAYGGTKAAVVPMIDRRTGFCGPEARAAFAAQFNRSGKLASAEQVAEVVAGLADRTRPYCSGDVLLVAGPSVTIMQ